MTDRSLKIALVASLVINIFLIGAGVGAAAFWLARPHERGVERPIVRAGGPARAALAQRRPLRAAADALAPAQRQAFRQALRQARQDAAADVQAARAHRQDLAEALAAPSLDRARVEAAMAGARQADGAVRARAERAVIDFAAGLSPEDRAGFIAGLRRSGTIRPAAENPATGNPTSAR